MSVPTRVRVKPIRNERRRRHHPPWSPLVGPSGNRRNAKSSIHTIDLTPMTNTYLPPYLPTYPAPTAGPQPRRGGTVNGLPRPSVPISSRPTTTITVTTPRSDSPSLSPVQQLHSCTHGIVTINSPSLPHAGPAALIGLFFFPPPYGPASYEARRSIIPQDCPGSERENAGCLGARDRERVRGGGFTASVGAVALVGAASARDYQGR